MYSNCLIAPSNIPTLTPYFCCTVAGYYAVSVILLLNVVFNLPSIAKPYVNVTANVNVNRTDDLLKTKRTLYKLR